MTAKEFSIIAPGIPTAPGIYKYFDADQKLLYVGKAKHLRKRVSSYFTKQQASFKTIELVSRIKKIEFTIVNSEHEALLLENALIKENQPVFNIDLKDDKTYPYIVVKNEAFPRVFLTRSKYKDGSQYFGPFTSVAKVRDILNFVKQNIQLRTCKLNLSPQNIAKNKYKVCLEYHLGNCKGPCEGLQTEEDYQEGLTELTHLFKGNIAPVLSKFKLLQRQYIEMLEFEKAAFYQNKIENLQKYHARSAVVNTNTGTVDVFSILEEGDMAYVNYLAVSNGSIIQTQTIVLKKQLDEMAAEVLSFAIVRIREKFNSEALEIIVPIEIEYAEPNITITIPKAGDKKKLLDLSEKNVNYFKAELKAKKMLHLEGKTNDEKATVLKNLQHDLSLPLLPEIIECFDNSNFQGSYPVAAMVSFKNGEPSKADYRHYNIKTVVGINDFASMAEVVHRRYSRVLAEKLTIPQLIIIDGGKGQLSAAMESIKNLGLNGKTTLVGLAKNQEELFYAGDQQSLQLGWNSESLKLIRRIRDEVHRFGITFHRNKRSTGAFKNELEGIKGIGKQTAMLLLKTYKSVKKVRETSPDALAALIGKSKTDLLLSAFAENDIIKKGPE